MLRLLLILLLCALFAACSSDDSTALKEWFNDNGIATSYGKDYDEFDVSLKSYSLGYDYDTSYAYMVSSYAVLGNVNKVEQQLYFGLKITDSLSRVWRLRADSIFYKEIYGGKVPEEYKNIEARFYWLWEDSIKHDTTWLKLQEQFKDSADIRINWKSGGTRDTFSLSLPDTLMNEFSKLKAANPRDTLNLLVGIKIIPSNKILRIAPPTTSDIPNILRVAQKTYAEPCGDLCLYSGIKEFLDVVLEVGNKIKVGKPIIFAQLVLPKSANNTVNELAPHPLPVYVYNNGSLEDYRVDEAFVKAHNGHPNLVFWEYDTLKLQLTKNLRNYINADTIGFTLRLGPPMLNPKSLYFYNSAYSTEKVFSDRPVYSNYDFNTVFNNKNAKLRLWYAETD